MASDRSISHYSAHSSGWNGRGPAPDRTTPPPTQQPPESPYDLWYYKVSHCGNIYTRCLSISILTQDDSDFVQGPYTSVTMLEWQRAGYFRSGLLLRREVDNIFSNLATYTQLYGRFVLCCTVLYCTLLSNYTQFTAGLPSHGLVTTPAQSSSEQHH